MDCPNCGKQIDLIPPAELNLETYNRYGSVLATSHCCGVAFRVRMKQTFNYEVYTGDDKEDNWGNKIKKYEKLSTN